MCRQRNVQAKKCDKVNVKGKYESRHTGSGLKEKVMAR